MESSVKTNRMAVVSMISGLVIPLSLGLYWALFRIAYQTLPGFASGIDNPIIRTIMDLSVSLRQICAPVALVSGFLALRQIRKLGGIEKGKVPAWIGIILGSGWILFGLLIGLIFLIGEIPL